MTTGTKYQIPRIIHYFWLGKGEKPESVINCIDTWKKNCPDFEIREWNESNYDIHKNPFMEKAYKERKWAFVSDYGRMDVLYNYGGIYLDTDVEVLKDLAPLCQFKAFMGFENTEFVNDGQGFGCVAGLPIIKEMLDCYTAGGAIEFGGKSEGYVESPKLRTRVFLKHGLRQDGSRQTIDGFEIFPVDYFCPLDYDTGRIHITDNTYSIHHFDGSWHGGNAKKAQLLMQRINRVFGKKLGRILFSNLMQAKDAVRKMVGK